MAYLWPFRLDEGQTFGQWGKCLWTTLLLSTPIGKQAVSNVIRRRASTLRDNRKTKAAEYPGCFHRNAHLAEASTRRIQPLVSAVFRKKTISLNDLDDALREAVVSCCCVIIDDKCWDRATIPLTFGGVGILLEADSYSTVFGYRLRYPPSCWPAVRRSTRHRLRINGVSIMRNMRRWTAS